MNKVSVLIVESKKSVIDHLSNKFSDMGLSVITALDGFEGYVRACNEMPNYVVRKCEKYIVSFMLSRIL